MMLYCSYMNHKKIALTGINGFVGKHVARQLVAAGHSVIGIGNGERVDNDIRPILENYIQQDIAEAWPNIEPVDVVINLAALAVVGASFEHPQSYISINSSIITNICEYYLKNKVQPRIICISTGTIYSPFQNMPLDEDSSINISSPYVISKLLNENQVSYYRSRGLDCISVRPFNHIGPGQQQGFLIPDLLNKLSLARDSGQDYITTGNVKTKRDYTDVRDVARAYVMLSEAQELHHNEYNICSGKSYSGESILEILKKITSNESIGYKIDASKVRPNDPVDIYGTYSRINNDIGWKPEISLETTLKDCVDFFVNQSLE
jgi:GDP-4-dehydro-6-deoxy-D-mannose reductase